MRLSDATNGIEHVQSGLDGGVSEVTHLLREVEEGNQNAAEQLLGVVYSELRRLAAQKMARERPDQTLQPTALVHEAWLRLNCGRGAHFENRAHFFAACAEAMRRILIENARRKRAARHGGGWQRVDLDGAELGAAKPEDQLLAVDEALDRLAAQNEREAQLVKLRYFVGMTLEEAAEALGISPRSADNYWAHARAWLFRELKNA